MNRRYPLVAQRAGHRSEYGRAPEVEFNMEFEVEHVLPPSRGGGDDDDNLALACRACNLHKAAHVTGKDDVPGDEPPLFHPRRDLWDRHFALESETGLIRGITPIGRATVSRLCMNASIRPPARLLWMRLGLMP